MALSASLKKRGIYLTWIILLVAAGLSSREFSFIPKEVGDSLWAMMVYCLFRILILDKPMIVSGALALSVSFLDEFEQLIHTPWLDSIRSTTMGHLILGQGFNWQDLVAYTIGIGITLAIDLLLNKKNV